MNRETAEAVWKILQEECGTGDDRWGFVHHQTGEEPPVEWRFIGAARSTRLVLGRPRALRG